MPKSRFLEVNPIYFSKSTVVQSVFSALVMPFGGSLSGNPEAITSMQNLPTEMGKEPSCKLEWNPYRRRLRSTVCQWLNNPSKTLLLINGRNESRSK